MNCRSLASVLTLTLLLGGCTYDDDDVVDPGRDDRYGEGSYVTDDPSVYVSTIDTGATLADILPGEETGVYIDYVEDGPNGSWGVYVSCDELLSGVPCAWDIIATPHYGYVDFAGDLLEYSDAMYWYDAGVQMVADTHDDLDGFILDTDAGVPVRFDIFLDGQSGQRYVYWVGEGGVHMGAPSNPIDLRPSSL